MVREIIVVPYVPYYILTIEFFLQPNSTQPRALPSTQQAHHAH
jgi:hypothetical protein